MKSSLYATRILLTAGLVFSSTPGGERVLQNGKNGYGGCTDTHKDFKPAFTTFTKSDTLKTEHFYTALSGE